MINRTLTLREAANVNDFAGFGTLEGVLRAIHQQDAPPQDRTAPSGQSFVQCRSLHISADHLLIHLVGYTPDDLIQVLPVNEPGVQLAEAPAGMEFLDGEMMLHVRGNSVLICRCGLPDGAFMAYVEYFAAAMGQAAGAVHFALGKRVDVDKLALIAEEGVHKLRMNAVAHAVSTEGGGRTTVIEKVTGTILDEIKDLLAIEHALPEEAENLKVEVSLSFDKRKGTQVDRDSLQQLAETVLDQGDDGFQIETMTGRKVRAADILLSKTVAMQKFGKSVHHQEAWGHLVTFDQELRAPENG